MKNRIFLAFLFAIVSSLSFAQDWSNEQAGIIKEFNLYENDHRGVIFINSGSECDEQAESPIDAAKIFFEPQIRKDLMKICVEGLDQKYMDHPLELREVIDLYLEYLSE